MIDDAVALRAALAPLTPDERDVAVLLALQPALAGIDALLAAVDLGNAP
jgi:hypothetical protein